MKKKEVFIMRKVKFSIISALGYLVLVATFGIGILFGGSSLFDQKPELTYSTFLGGGEARDCAVDNDGFAYVLGFHAPNVSKLYPGGNGDADLVWSTELSGWRNGGVALDADGYIYASGIFYSAEEDSNKIFVSKLDNAGNELYYKDIGLYGDGVHQDTQDTDITVDGSGNIYVVGRRRNASDNNDVLIVKLSPSFDILYTTLIGGSDHERGTSIAVDDSGYIYVTGLTNSDDFPTTSNGFQQSFKGPTDVFVAKLEQLDGLSPSANVVYATYIGGYEARGDEKGLDIACDDASGHVYLTGRISSQIDLPVSFNKGYDITHNGYNDGFLAVLDTLQTQAGSLVYFTYLGGSRAEWGTSIALDSSGYAYVFGITESSDFLATADTSNAFDATFNGQFDGFLVVIDPSIQPIENSLLSWTYFGSKKSDKAGGVALRDGTNNINVYLAGYTDSRTDFPTTSGAYDEGFDGRHTNAFVSVLTFTSGAPPDTTPPAGVIDLLTGDSTAYSIDLTWTAPGDDGDTGTASQYDIRYSTAAITESNWGSANQCTGEPSPSSAGTLESFTATGLSPSTTYWFALKTADEVPNWSGISNITSGTTGVSTPQTMHVADIDMSLKKKGARVNAIATVTIVDDSGTPVSGATVYCFWSGATSDNNSGVTDSNGQVTFKSDTLKNPPSGTTFIVTVDNVVKAGWTYNPSANVETSDSITY